MGRKAKYTYEEKLQACMDYLSRKRSAKEIADRLQMRKDGPDKVRQWVKQYQTNGPEILQETKTNTTYTKEFKLQVVEEYLSGSGSLRELQVKYKIRSSEQIRRWISKYNSHEELKDYDPHPEVYMAKRKKTTQEERKEIVEYCIAHDKDYKGTAAFYDVSYSQVYNWVRKYLSEGEEGLVDKRGHHKSDDELSELELLRRENIRLKKKLEEEGLFRQEHKKPLPKFPQKIGVVTSSTGAAIQDIFNVLKRRFPVAEVVLRPCQVQGEGAAKDIANAIEFYKGLIG